MANLSINFQKPVGDYLVQIVVSHSGRRRFTLLGATPDNGGFRPVVATGDINWGQSKVIVVDIGTVPEGLGPDILQVSYDMYR
jgi:hypothetical protein